MERKEVEDQLDSVRELLDDRDEITVFEAASQPFQGFVFDDRTLSEFAQKGLEIGVTDFYLLEDRNDEGAITLAGLCFFHNDRPHSIYHQPNESIDPEMEDTTERATGQVRRLGARESEEEQQRKQEIADELLAEYDEYLEEDERFEIENRLDVMRLRRLLRLKQRVEEEASVDPEEEKRLARAVFDDERFNRQFNEMDTEMLLDELDLEFNPNDIRTGEVHNRAKSLLKINN